VSFRPTRLDDLPLAPPVQPLPVIGISVVDLTKPNNEYQDKLLGTGFNRIGDTQFASALGETLRADLERGLRKSIKGDVLDVWILDLGFYWEKTGADFVPIVNIFTYGQSGRFMCSALLNVRLGTESRKLNVENIVSMDTAGTQSGESIYKQPSRNCYSGLVPKTMEAIAEFARRKHSH
jgi:hypothetical protein